MFNFEIKLYSEQRDKLFEALANSQAEFLDIIPTGKSKYGIFATYLDMFKATKKSLKANGLGVNFNQLPMGDKIWLMAKLTHSSGQFDGGLMELVIETEMVTSSGKKYEKNNMQAQGSSVSYAMRYLYKTILGLAINDADEDDGEATNKNETESGDTQNNNQSKKAQSYNNSPKKDLKGTATQPQIDNIKKYLKDPTYVDALYKKYTLLTNIPKQVASDILDALFGNKPLPDLGGDKQVTMYEQDGNIVEGDPDFEEVNNG